MRTLMELETEVSELQRQLAQVKSLANTARRSNDNFADFLLIKRDKLRFKMYQEPGHNLPHIHIDYGRESHVASYSIHPTVRLAGTLDREHDRIVIAWILSHKEKLRTLWTAVQAGKDSSNLVIELAGDK